MCMSVLPICLSIKCVGSANGSQKSVSYHLELEWFMNYHVGAVINSGSSLRVAHVLKCCAISESPVFKVVEPFNFYQLYRYVF